ncbi:unnamed protein product [Pleuronectes platessa]|uniref:Secreted protein n=1 Tax=Pleuronectes platessa TaxID=8262 RepID=A0A9N7Z8S9_PLEPL|nr:unnamed protein product [Pleuronectes platessa]
MGNCRLLLVRLWWRTSVIFMSLDRDSWGVSKQPRPDATSIPAPPPSSPLLPPPPAQKQVDRGAAQAGLVGLRAGDYLHSSREAEHMFPARHSSQALHLICL